MPDKNSGIIKLHGREYKTVALRVSEFRALFSIGDGWGIATRIISIDDAAVVFRAAVVNPDGKEVAVGFSEEKRPSRGINSTSALENCETSAIGRALAAAGFGGSEYASADELTSALKKQAQPNRVDPVTKELQEQADTARKAAHHPSFTRDHARWFFVKLSELGISYDAVSAYTVNNGWSTPSTWPADKRRGLLDSLADGQHPDIPRKTRKGSRS